MNLGSIRNRILLAALAPVVLVVVSVGALMLTRHAQEIERNLVERAVSLARQAAMLSELPLATGSNANARAAADFIERSSGIVGLSLVDRDGVTVDNRGNLGNTALRMLDGKPMSVQVERDSHLVSVVHPVVLFSQPTGSVGSGASNAGQRVGFVALSVSRADEKRDIAKLWWTGAAILLAATLLSLVLVQMATRSIPAPLSALSNGLSRVARDNFSVQLPETGRGEFRELAMNFNQMTGALQTARRGLRDDVKRATEALAQRTREAESASNAKSRFLAAASHDLRQPAHALSLYVAALRQGLKQQAPDVSTVLTPAVDGMQAAARSLDALLNAVLDISRFDAGVVTAEIQSVALKPLVHEVITVLASSAKEKGLNLRSRVPDVSVQSDPTLLRRVIDNLVSNAVRFSRSGSILVAVRPRADHYLLQVWDQGVGIAPLNLPLIFDEFYQVRRGDMSQGGMGLGLAIVSRSAAMLSAGISVRSRVGRGTCFTLQLPGAPMALAAHQQSQMLATNASSNDAHRPRRVLVLDDDALVRDSMRSLFASFGLQATAESTVNALIAVAERERDEIAAAVVDYRLQDGFTGIEAARKLRRILGATVPVVLITGDTSAERLRILGASGFPVLHKPLNPDQLLAALGLSQQSAGRAT